MKVSVIVPVYNAEEFVVECVNSIRNQSIQDMEIICINDGSTDQSAELLTAISKEDERMIIVHQTNQGVSVARNTGLSLAKGEYITFVDADDYIEPTYLASFFEFATADLISSRLSTLQTFEGLAYNQVYPREVIEEVLYPMMLKGDQFNAVWSKVFKNSVIQNNNILFPKGQKLGEDAHFIMQYLRHAQDITFVENDKYIYRENTLSATRFVKDDSFFNQMFEEFQFDHRKNFDMVLQEEHIRKLKTNRLLQAFMAALSLYFRGNSVLTYPQRKEYIKKALNEINFLLKDEEYNYFLSKSKGFQKKVLEAIQKQNYFKLRLYYQYSHWRNGIK